MLLIEIYLELDALNYNKNLIYLSNARHCNIYYNACNGYSRTSSSSVNNGVYTRRGCVAWVQACMFSLGYSAIWGGVTAPLVSMTNSSDASKKPYTGLMSTSSILIKGDATQPLGDTANETKIDGGQILS